MKRFGSLRNPVGVVVLGALIAAVVAVASAQAAPSKKNYTVQVAVTNDALSHQDFTVKITNDKSSNTTFGSANVVLPTGFTAGTATTEQAGWIPTIVTDSSGTSTIQLRSDTSGHALVPGQSMTVLVHVTSPSNLPITPTSPTGCGGTATWSSTAKQSNDYNGTNNWFTLISPPEDLTPLGSFAWDPIGTMVNGVFAPAIYTNKGLGLPGYPSPSPTVHALDTCGAPKTGYKGPTTLEYSGNSATVSGPTWSASGVGTVSIAPTISETNRTLTLTDTLARISQASDPFDTQDRICTSVDTSCTWGNGNSINASSNGPSQGSLGVGFNPVLPFSCNGGTVPLGQTVITISPHGTSNPGDQVPYQVTIVYSKQVSGTGNANSFAFCESTTEGVSWTQLLPCSTYSTTPLPDCVVDQKRVTGGALQVIINLLGDPYIGGK
jgi:hypothetical protein